MLVVATKSRTDPGAEVKGRHVMLRISLLAALTLAVAVSRRPSFLRSLSRVLATGAA